MIIIFAFAITPKRFFHNLVANHKDISYAKHDGKNEVTKSSIYCHCDSMVATSPFTDVAETFAIITSFFFVLHLQHFISSFLANSHYFFGLRGPPAFAALNV